MTPRRALGPLALASALALAAILAAGAQEPPEAPREPEKAPVMERPARSPDLAGVRLQTLDGVPVTLRDLAGGRPTLLVFWATWCPDCRRETPALKALWEAYGPKGLQVVAASTGGRDTVEMVRDYVAKNALAYPVLYDADKAASKAYGIAWIPTFLLLDGTGKVVSKAAAPPGGAAVEALLAGRPLPE